jgi:CRISPR-associated endoribonuclease Cas6
MRVKITLGSSEQKRACSIRKDYKPIIISLLKAIFKSTPIFYELYSKEKKTIPFCSSLYLGKKMAILLDSISFEAPISLFFSTGDLKVFSYFINGCLNFKNQGNEIHILNDETLIIQKIEPLNKTKITTENVVFKTMSPIVLQNPNVDKTDYENFYVTYNQKEFENILNIITQNRMNYLNINNYTKIKITSDYNKTDSIPHYGGYIKATRGVFNVKSSVETLQFLYDYGFGTRTGQLFGMTKLL